MRTYDIIVRISSRDDDAESAEDQVNRCKDHIVDVLHGRVGRTFDPKADQSGWTSVDSPEYRAALVRVQKGASDGIVFRYKDRLARNVRALGRYFDELEEAGAEVVFVDKPELDYRTDDGRMETTIDGLMSERKLLSDRKRGNDLSRKFILEYGVSNSCPYGYRRNLAPGKARDRILSDRHDKVLVPDETAPVVRRIFAERIDGVSWTEIVDGLERDGIPGPRGGHWSVSTLRSIVRNECYLGFARYERRKGRRGKLTGEVLRNEHAHEAIVTRAQYNAAQSATKVQRSGTYSAGIAGGLLFCGTCGGRLAVAGSLENLTYGCRRQVNGGRCTAPVFVTKSRTDAFVEAEVLDALAGIEPARGDNDHISRLTAERDAARETLDTALERSMMLRDPSKAQALIERCEAALDAAEGLLEGALAKTETLDGLLPTAEHWQGLTGDERRRIAGVLIERITVGAKAARIEDRFTITAR
jgi:hypothetical protein